MALGSVTGIEDGRPRALADDTRESMLTYLRVNREIMAAWTAEFGDDDEPRANYETRIDSCDARMRVAGSRVGSDGVVKHEGVS